MKIILPDHSLEGVKKIPTLPNNFYNGGRVMDNRQCVVIHYTEGLTALSSIEYWKSQKCLKDDIGAHFTIDRDGEIIQTRACNRTISHAGKSRWVNPKTGKKFTYLNQHSIGIELANTGNETDRLGDEKLKDYAGFITDSHRNNPSVKRNWEKYSEKQIVSLVELLKALITRYNLDDITGHDCIAPERKTDPGPAFPMQKIREMFGFKGLPTVHWS